MTHPQLQLLAAKIAANDAEWFFGEVVPELLRTHGGRRFGGRYGIRVGAREWVIDLDHGRVSGDAYGSAVSDDDGLDAVIVMAGDFAVASDVVIYAQSPAHVQPLVDWLAAASR